MIEISLDLVNKLLGFQYVDNGYGTFSCRSCGSKKEVDYGDNNTPPSERAEECSNNCPWRQLSEARFYKLGDV